MWDLLKEIDWSDNGYKTALVIVIAAFLFSTYHLVRFIGNNLLKVFKKLEQNVEELKELNKNQTTEISLIKQEQKFQNEQILMHSERFKVTDERLDGLMQSLLRATKR